MDCLQDWPEPVVRVQSLSDSGAAVIPDRYIKPPSERPCDVEGAALDSNPISIPVVDLNCEDTVHAVSEACRSRGFFQAVNHRVSPELMRRAREEWREFFHLPMEEKQLYANSPKTYEGYGSRLGIKKGAILDWGDYYFLHLLPRCLKDHGKWPASPPMLRETVEEYGCELLKLCQRVIKVLSMGLGLDEECLLRAFGGDDSGSCMRVNFYPKCPQPSLTLGLSSHSDPGGITVLLPDDRVKGLQVRNGDSWITVQPVPDAFIINVGDQIQGASSSDNVATLPLSVDVRDIFSTDCCFESHEEAINWCREVGRQNNIVIVISRSKRLRPGRPMVELGCERGGVFRCHGKKDEGSQRKVPKINVGTRKCGCLFKLHIKNTKEGKWIVHVKNGMHNHALAETLTGHPYVGRLNTVERLIVEDLATSGVAPKQIYSVIRHEDEKNKSTMKSIYNAISHSNSNANAKTMSMQKVLQLLAENHYVEHHRRHPRSNEVISMFWAHPGCTHLARTFADVLVLDCTYKTNKFKMPIIIHRHVQCRYCCGDADKHSMRRSRCRTRPLHAHPGSVLSICQ